MTKTEAKAIAGMIRAARSRPSAQQLDALADMFAGWCNAEVRGATMEDILSIARSSADAEKIPQPL